MLKDLNPVPDLPKQEKETIEFWKKLDIVNELKKIRKGAQEKVYYDGPITANNNPHYGHVIQWTLKDLIPRYWNMQGYYVSRNMGWDCQGLPVEVEVEKEQGFEGKEDIEKFGIAKFNALCRKAVTRHRDNIYKYETLVGRWFDEADMYYTMDSTFIESIWWSFKELYNKDLIYKGHKVLPYSTKAGCTLSQHEVNLGGYKDIEEDAITIKFKLIGENNTYVLAWTTTPWTMPGNLLLAVGRTIKYVKVKEANSYYILAESLVKTTFKGRKYTIVEDVKAKDLEGREYEPLFDYYKDKRSEGCFKIIVSDLANDEDGTGVVHLAPYGEKDFDVFVSLNISVFDYLDDSAVFTNDIPEYAGLFYKKANTKIISDLKDKNLLFNHKKFVHRMPVCWRTNIPLIYKPVESWYVAVSKLKKRMLEDNETIKWVPEYLKDGASKMWISNARDWAISRSRYWGTPMPVWVNDKTEEIAVIGSFKELEKKSGKKIDDPHRPYVDKLTWKDSKSGGTFKRVPDVLDVWYDSGAVPFAKLHYPFENKDIFDKKFPADVVAEAVEQVRLWYYTMFILGIALFDKAPFKAAVTHGMMLDKESKKLSKSKRNYPPMDEVLNTFGADVLRLFILTSPVVQGESVRFYLEPLQDIKRSFFMPLWNSLRYFVSYSDGKNLSLKKPISDNILDRWILTRLQNLTNEMNSYLDNYLIMKAARELPLFVQDLSTWYIRRSRDRIKNVDKEAQKVIFYVFSQFSKLIAPFVPFLAEEIYQVLDLPSLTGLKSVHMDLFPKSQKISSEDGKLLEQMSLTRKINSAALSVRVTEKLRVRQPLGNLYVKLSKDSKLEFFQNLIQEEVNVKKVSITKDAKKNMPKLDCIGFVVYLDTNITEDLRIEGLYREMVRKIQDSRKKQKMNVQDKIKVVYKNSEDNEKIMKKFGTQLKKQVLANSIETGDLFSVTKASPKS